MSSLAEKIPRVRADDLLDLPTGTKLIAFNKITGGTKYYSISNLKNLNACQTLLARHFKHTKAAYHVRASEEFFEKHCVYLDTPEIRTQFLIRRIQL